MTINIGTAPPTDIYIGSDAATAVYVGSVKVWPVAVTPPPVTQVLYFGDAQAALGSGTSGVYTTALDGPYTSPTLLGFTGVDFPVSVAVDSTGVVYVANGTALGGTAAIYRLDGVTQTTVSASVYGQLAIGPDDALYYADATATKVYKWSAGTTTDIGLTGLSSIFGVAVDSAGAVYVSDNTAKKVYKYVGGTQSDVGFTGLTSPAAVAVDASGTVYVADVRTDKLIKYVFGTQSDVGFTGLTSPAAVAVDASGTVYVENQDTCNLLSYNGTTQTTINAGISAGHVIASVAVGPPAS